MNKKTIFASIVVTLAIIGGYFFPKVGFFGSTNNAVGTTYNSAKIAQINFSPITGSATSTSILNTDATDRIVTDTYADCNTVGTSKTAYSGTGLAALIFQAATTSTASPATVSNTNIVMYNIISTSTPDMYFASTTIGVAAYGRVWATGSYMTFWSNATNTSVCTIGVKYISF